MVAPKAALMVAPKAALMVAPKAALMVVLKVAPKVDHLAVLTAVRMVVHLVDQLVD